MSGKIRIFSGKGKTTAVQEEKDPGSETRRTVYQPGRGIVLLAAEEEEKKTESPAPDENGQETREETDGITEAEEEEDGENIQPDEEDDPEDDADFETDPEDDPDIDDAGEEDTAGESLPIWTRLLDKVSGRENRTPGADTDPIPEKSAEAPDDSWWQGDGGRREISLPAGLENLREKALLVLRWLWKYRRIVLPLVLLFSVLLGLLGYNRLLTFRRYIVASTYENHVTSGSNYVAAGTKYIYRYNADGISCVSRTNEVQWSITYSMQAPITDLCGTTLAIAEQQGMKIYVINEEGEIGHFETESPILKVRVSSQGIVAAVLSEDDVTWVNLYTADGSLLASDKTTLMDFGYPADCAISPDGQRLAVSYIQIREGVLTDQVVFYHFGNAGQKKENHIVGSWTYNGIVVPDVYYADNTRAVAVSGKGYTVYDGSDIPKKGTEITFGEEIISCFYEGSSIGFVFRNEEGDEPFRMELYNLSGKKRMSCKVETNFDSIKMQNDQILMYNDRNMTVYTSSGHLRFTSDYEKVIVAFFYLKEYRKYLVITPDSFDRIRVGT